VLELNKLTLSDETVTRFAVLEAEDGSRRIHPIRPSEEYPLKQGRQVVIEPKARSYRCVLAGAASESGSEVRASELNALDLDRRACARRIIGARDRRSGYLPPAQPNRAAQSYHRTNRDHHKQRGNYDGVANRREIQTVVDDLQHDRYGHDN